MTNSRWELIAVTLASVTGFFSVWYLVSPLLH
jgi:hypothetical protein